MSLTALEVEFIHSVANRVESIVIANCTPGRWRAGSGVSQATKSTLRAVFDDDPDTEYLLGTAIDKNNQRAMMAAQPEVLRANVGLLRAVDDTTPDPLAEQALNLAQLHNKVMTLKVPEPATVS